MKKLFLLLMVILTAPTMKGQEDDVTTGTIKNSAEAMLANDGKLNIGGYGEVHFNQPLSTDSKELGTLDVHRMVMFLGYNYSKNTQFISEIEYEHAKELWVEQAFLQQKISKFINLRAGLLLVPVGIINEYHEPSSFNGVERPVIDSRITLSTWREIGFGFSGNLLPVSMRYQLYAVGGLNGYDTKAVFNGAAGLREGRQKGSKAYLSSPAITGKIEYFGLRNLNIGLSGYAGKSQSRLYANLADDDSDAGARADSSVIGIVMLGADARYRFGGFEFRGQFNCNFLSNTQEYNKFSRTGLVNNDLGKSMMGLYAESGYNVLRHFGNTDNELIPFIRYEFYNTHFAVDPGASAKLLYKNNIITAGITLRIDKKAVFKTDIQFAKSGIAEEYGKTLNAGIGVMF